MLVCPELLRRLNAFGFLDTDANPGIHEDPFTGQIIEVTKEERNDHGLMLKNDCSFLVLSCGSIEKLKEIQRYTGWIDVPFIADNDFSISSSLYLNIQDAEIMPAILFIDEDLRVETVAAGRMVGLYKERELLMYLAPRRTKAELTSTWFLMQADRLIQQLNVVEIFPMNHILPLEIFDTVFRNLPLTDLAAVGAVSKSFRSIVSFILKDTIRKQKSKMGTHFGGVYNWGEIKSAPELQQNANYLALTKVANFVVLFP
ncbi:hypothetical protein HK096_000261 [Nowakowskiella sp. JEL0078]|nr:hypothetical protein HK096_000261 [Nowakowskiella sp. JEL0078]